MNEVDKSWHLAQNAKEMDITEFEILLWRVFHGFLRWQEDCEHSANGNDLTGNELSILHIIRMKERPKSISDIGRLLNREDNFNITYSIKKLLKLGLIERSKEPTKRGTTYQITEAGIENTDNFVKARKNILVGLYQKEKDMNLLGMIEGLSKVKSLYDEAGRLCASYQSVL